MSDVPRSLQQVESTIQTVVLTADVFQLFKKSFFFIFLYNLICYTNPKIIFFGAGACLDQPMKNKFDLTFCKLSIIMFPRLMQEVLNNDTK